MKNNTSDCCDARIISHDQCENCGATIKFENNLEEQKANFPELDEPCYMDEKRGIVGKVEHNNPNVGKDLLNKLMFGKNTSKYFPDRSGKRIHL